MRALVLGQATLVSALACLACGGDGASEPSPGSTGSMTHVARSTTPAVRSCEDGALASGPFRIVPLSERLETVALSVSDALTKAAAVSAATYGWTPADPICVFIFPGDVAFLDGLEQLRGFDQATVDTYKTFLGTVGRDVATGRDAIFLNAAFPTWIPFGATHEFFHIVQAHTGGPQQFYPTWFLEGVADWEAAKLQPPSIPSWLALLISEQRAGRGHSLSSLATWEQWREVVARGNPAIPSAGYHKARAAAMFLEQIAGPTAAAQILSAGAMGNASSFEDVFREVTGLDVTDFEARLDEFLVSSSP